MISSNKILLGFIFLISVLFVSCDKVDPEGPTETLLDTTLVAPISTLTIPISYDVQNLESLVNDKLEGVFFKKWLKLNKDGDSLYLELERTSRADLSWSNSALQTSFPIHVSGNFIKKFMGMSLKNQAPIEAEMVLHLNTNVSVNPDWSLNTTTKLLRIDWKKNPELKIAMISLDIKDPIEEQLFANQETLLAELDKVLREELKTREEVSKIWNDIQKEIIINKEDPKVYLIAKGESLSARFLDDNTGLLTLLVQMKAYAETREGEAPPFVEQPLPVYNDQINEEDSVQIFVLAKLSFDRANQILKEQLIGEKFTFSNAALTINNLNLYATDDGLVMEVEVKGAVNGHLFMVGKPAFDEETSTFWVENLEYDIQTENVLVKSADALLHENFLSYISEKLVFEAGSLIDELPNMIVKALDKGKTGEKMELEIANMHAMPYSIVLDKKEIQVILETRARMGIQLKGLSDNAKSVMIN